MNNKNEKKQAGISTLKTQIDTAILGTSINDIVAGCTEPLGTNAFDRAFDYALGTSRISPAEQAIKRQLEFDYLLHSGVGVQSGEGSKNEWPTRKARKDSPVRDIVRLKYINKYEAGEWELSNGSLAMDDKEFCNDPKAKMSESTLGRLRAKYPRE